MGKGIGNRRDENCWTYKSTFEKALIVSSLVPFVIVVVLVTFLLFQLTVEKNAGSCTNPVCQIEAKHLAERVDTSTNPCNDFYQFSCGSLWKNGNQTTTADPFTTIVQESKEQIMSVYNEPTKITDYRIVKAAKLFYRTCLNATEFKAEDLEFINATLNGLGGWPVVLGTEWDDSQFWWIRATPLLRQAGLFFGSVIDVSVITDAKSESKFILKVAIPEPGDTQVGDISDFVEVATILGAREDAAAQDFEEMYKFSMDLRREIFRRYNDEPPRTYAISAFQNKYEFINWRDFLNSIVGPTLIIKDDDKILFDSADGFHQWIDFFTKAPKRNQANYMIWKALEPLLPYIQNRRRGPEEDRAESCIEEIRDRFSPSPLDIVYVQKHLPDTKITLANDLVNGMKAEVLELLEKCDWLEASEKEKAKERLTNMTQIVGAPESYLGREIFYQMDVDMSEPDERDGDGCFVSHLLRANKNYQSRVYQQVSKGPMTKWSLQTGSLIGDYYWEDNTINIPATVLQGAIFNEARPKYVNYGSIGMLLSHHFLRILTGEKSAKLFDADNSTDSAAYQRFEERLSKCLGIEQNNTYLVDIVLQQSLGFQISYGAYKKSVHAKEDLGFGGYTANQLYWLSAASYFCRPDPDFGNATEANLFLSSVASNKNFGDDFHCAPETKMHPRDKCTIF